MRHAKIVCTLGPATATHEIIKQIALAGMNVARLNFSHGDRVSHQSTFDLIRRVAKEIDRPIAILADLCGPKIRVGQMKGDEITLSKGKKLRITTEEIMGTDEQISTSFRGLPQNVRPNQILLLDDGNIELKVLNIISTREIECEVIIGGPLRAHKGLNIPFAKISIPALTEKDKHDIEFGKQLGVDYFALSFVQSPEDIEEAKKLAGDIPVIAKMEKPGAIDYMEDILDLADGIMVARGDLALEVGAEKVPALQKQLIRETNNRGKPVIVATQMLESMIHSPHPTRAEVSDVANAILDGADALMLSAETASGQYPVQAVETMSSIISEAEKTALSTGSLYRPSKFGKMEFRHAIAHAAANAALDLELSAVVVGTHSGRSAALVSAYRPGTKIIGLSKYPAVLNRMSLFWGVWPLEAPLLEEVGKNLVIIEKRLKDHEMIEKDDEIAMITGMGANGDGPLDSVVLRLWRVK